MKTHAVSSPTFAEHVRTIVARIPKGSVATYGQVAQAAGRPGAARAVGAVMRTNKDTKSVPCHRVVGADGTLTGYAFGAGITSKRALLEKEGVQFKGTRVDLARSQFQNF
jgi:O-6-methylguanine DNA methyltransferase